MMIDRGPWGRLPLGTLQHVRCATASTGKYGFAEPRYTRYMERPSPALKPNGGNPSCASPLKVVYRRPAHPRSTGRGHGRTHGALKSLVGGG